MGICMTTVRPGDVHHIDIKPRVELIGKRAAVPIVFILGGPTSLKLDHCHQLAQNKKNFVHLNVDLVKTSDELSSKDALMIFMLKINETEKRQVETEVLLITGFPRNIDDITEYKSSSVTGSVAGVILLDFVEQNISRQVKRAMEIGHVNANLATVESRDKDLLEMAHFFRNKGKLHTVDMLQSSLQVFEKMVEIINEIIDRTATSSRTNKSAATAVTQQTNDPIRYCIDPCTGNLFIETIPIS